MSDAVIMGIDDGVDTFQGELKDETQPLNYICEYGSETHLREVPIYVKSRIVTS